MCVLSMFLILNLSCEVNRKDSLSISLIDVFEAHPTLSKSGNIIEPGQLQLTLELSNRGDHNYIFCFDSWLKEKKDSITCFIRVPCKNGEAMDLSLGYITHPQILLPSNTTDTVTLEADYRELHSFYENCQASSSVANLDIINFNYLNRHSNNKVIVNDKTYEFMQIKNMEL